MPELGNKFLTWLKKVRSRDIETAFSNVNDMVGIPVGVNQESHINTSNCTELSAFAGDQTTEMRGNENIQNNEQVFTQNYNETSASCQTRNENHNIERRIAPNGNLRPFQSLLNNSDNSNLKV